MTTTTAKYGWEIPELLDAPDGVAQIAALAGDIEQTVQSAGLVTWSPTWTSTGSPKPTNPVGMSGRYTLNGGWCDFGFTMDMGGSTTGGRGQWQFTLPFNGNADIPEQIIRGRLYEPQVGNFILHGLIFPKSNLLWCFAIASTTTMYFGGLQQTNASGTAGTQTPSNGAGPTQAGGRIVFTGRYLVA